MPSGRPLRANVVNVKPVVEGLSRDLKQVRILTAIGSEFLESSVERSNRNEGSVVDINIELGGVRGSVEEGCGDRLHGRSGIGITNMILGRRLKIGKRIRMA